MHDSIHVPTTGWTVNHAVFWFILPWNHALFALFIFQYISSQLTVLDYEERAFFHGSMYRKAASLTVHPVLRY